MASAKSSSAGFVTRVLVSHERDPSISMWQQYTDYDKVILLRATDKDLTRLAADIKASLPL